MPLYGPNQLVVFPTGSAAADAQIIQGAANNAPAGTAKLVCAATAPWNLAGGGVVINRTGLTLDMTGCRVIGTGTGDLIDMHDSSTYGSRVYHGGGIIGMPFFDLTAMTGVSSAVHIGDIHLLKVRVIAYSNTPGNSCKGVWFDNRYALSEALDARVYTQSLRQGIQFDNSTGVSLSAAATGSFDRPNVDLRIDTNGVGDGVVLNAGAFLSDGKVGIYGNMDSNASNSYAALRMTGSNPGATIFSSMTDVDLFMGVENDDASTIAPQTINFGGAQNQFRGRAYLDFAQANPFAASNNTGQFLASAGNVRGDASLYIQPDLGSPGFTQNITANATTIFTQWLPSNKLTNAGAFTGHILAAGGYNNQKIVLFNAGSGSQTFAVPATSNVAQGTSAVLAPLQQRLFIWDSAAALWY